MSRPLHHLPCTLLRQPTYPVRQLTSSDCLITSCHRPRLRPSSSRRSRCVLRLRRLCPSAAAAAGHLRHAAGILPGLPGVRVPLITVPVVLQAEIHIRYLSTQRVLIWINSPLLQAPVNVPVPYAAPGTPPSYASVPLPAPYAKPPYYYSPPQAVLPLPTYPPSYNPATAVTYYQVTCFLTVQPAFGSGLMTLPLLHHLRWQACTGAPGQFC